MTGDTADRDDRVGAFLRMEYTTLRGELVKRAEFRQQILQITLGSATAILTIHAAVDDREDFARVLLAYPILVLLLAAGWLHHGRAMCRLATYAKTQIEPRFEGSINGEHALVGYETWLAKARNWNEGLIGAVSGIVTFVVLQILLFWLGQPFKTGFPSADFLLSVAGIVAILLTVVGWLAFKP
jgi:hypothetical protein